MTTRLIPTVFAVLLAAGCAHSSNSTEALLRELDRTLDMDRTYEEYFLQRTSVLSDLLQGAKTPEQEYEIRRKLSSEFASYSMDSTVVQLERNRRIARDLQDAYRLAHIQYEKLPIMRLRAGFQHQGGRFGDGHKIPDDPFIYDRYGTAVFDHAPEQRHYRARGPDHIAETDSTEFSNHSFVRSFFAAAAEYSGTIRA